MEDPAKDLIKAVQDELRGSPSLRWLQHKGNEWCSRADPDEAPPWLAPLAVSVLVAARESQRGSLAFYQPFSHALGLSVPITQEEYEETFFKWWLDMAKWLTDDNVGKRGLPSWRRIPQTGPRCVIGHPYTQILLRREDLQDLDAFLLSLGQLGPGDLEITDPAKAGADLLEGLRRWSVHRRVSGRLWEILHGNNRQASDSVQYMLLDRLLDEIDMTGTRILVREAKLVITLDAWAERRLRFSVVAPASLELWATRILTIDGQAMGPLEVGEPHVTPIVVDATKLDSGISVIVNNDIALIYRSSDIVVLAERDWSSIWCSVDDAEIGETVYLLVADSAIARVRRLLANFAPAAIEGVPGGWTLYGPNTLTLPSGFDERGLPMRRQWQAVPRLVGGLEIARHSYLIGGPPDVFIPSDSIEILLRLDDIALEANVRDDSLIDLKPLRLGHGSHHVDVGPYRLNFEVQIFEQLPVVSEVFGRTMLGAFVPPDRSDNQVIFAGAICLPEGENGPVILSPIGRRVVLLGQPGLAEECSVTMASWSRAAGVPQLVFEPMQRSSYSHSLRLLYPVFWVAVLDEATCAWSVTQVEQTATLRPCGQTVMPLAREVVTSIGNLPTVLRGGKPDVSPATAHDWSTYALSVLEAQ